MEPNEFLELFYSAHIGQLVGVLAAAGEQGGAKAAPSALGLIVELLCFCVQHHSFRIKYYVLRNKARPSWQRTWARAPDSCRNARLGAHRALR